MIKLQSNPFYKGLTSQLFTDGITAEVLAFHKKINGYDATPLVSLKKLASHIGVKNIFVKDESKRFGLNAFKVLGGSYALGKLLAEKLDVPITELDFKTVGTLLPEPLTFTTATAGNHGTGVAWAARELGQKAVVFMPKGSAQASVDRIKSLGAACIVTDVNYDDTVRLASMKADSKGWTLVQDTAWEGYEKIPSWISQGYMTMAKEAFDQLAISGEGKPTHVFLQAGVGAMAGGILGYCADVLGPRNFTSVIAEPAAADCLFRSVSTDDGHRVAVTGSLNSIMAGLACGEVNPVTWDILRDTGNFFISADDRIAATGMRVLGNPLSGDTGVISGESGALNMGLLYYLMTSSEPEVQQYRAQVGLTEESEILIFSTEGDTNPARYRSIVWDGVLPL
ncbi:diaminopropionate ammonia-lyase [Salmonella enterica subsp. enterica serovar Montevideo]|nr:diaminopropionate ammonia-lyase [Salmonella enterica subsp. enterica serovar Montevideo]EEK7814244.1 diaminopropionate ammonia-lyase [Salmonella enterica subsp. enterica serovar Montevideo]EEL0143514.1 diaminopropionate ammonia-lyase [Salmonella enterica subsp. enterica serovar Montevideo]